MPARLPYLFLFCISLVVFPFVIFNILLTRTSILPGARSFVISTGSMEPSLPVGSIIYTVSKSQYRVGDIIAFLKNNSTISHRIVGTTKVGKDTYYITKGDANTDLDQDLILEKNVYGKIIAYVPIIGKIILFYKNPFGIILGTVLPTLLLYFGPYRIF